uniref:SCY1-like protein 2 n=1 Tax=Eptatretus burgeri TaxID=7764 RepID=A0A8C4QA45_EPTBU
MASHLAFFELEVVELRRVIGDEMRVETYFSGIKQIKRSRQRSSAYHINIANSLTAFWSFIPYFEDVGAATLQYLDTLFQRDNLQKSQFFKGLPKVLPQLPKRVVQQRVLPCLMTEFVNPNMVPFVLPNVLLISEECSRVEYTHLVLPELIPIFKLQEPIQVLLIFLQKMDLLLTKTPAEDIKQHVLPMIFRALEAPSIQIQELCLNIIPTFANLIESSSMKNSLFPRIKNACLQTSSLAVRVNALVCMGKLLQYLEKWFVLDEVLPFLQLIPSKEPAVLMAILGIYKCTFSHKKLGITKEILAGKVLPHLVPLSIESSLNLSQFNSYIVIIKEMVSRIETEQRGKLEQLQPQVSLTLEEKQKLAKQQEQAQMLRNQKQLLPQSKAHTISNPQVHDPWFITMKPLLSRRSFPWLVSRSFTSELLRPQSTSGGEKLIGFKVLKRKQSFLEADLMILRM